MEQHKYYPPDFPVQAKIKFYPAGDAYVGNLDFRERVVFMLVFIVWLG